MDHDTDALRKIMLRRMAKKAGSHGELTSPQHNPVRNILPLMLIST